MYATRQSSSVDFANARRTSGFVKLRLAHGERGSIVIPDMLFVYQAGWKYFIPSFFGPPLLAFNMPSELNDGSMHQMQFSIDICAPLNIEGSRVVLKVSSADLCSKYPDGAQLYSCQILHDEPLVQHASGKCRKIDDEFWITVFHHTTAETVGLIKDSGHFRGSEWNIQGTRKLENVCYPYFTTLPRIRFDADLERIAMSSRGCVELLGTGLPPVRLSLPVYRENTQNRTSTLKVRLPVGLISPVHLRLFDPDVSYEPSYYEVVQPEIVRVGLNPGAVLKFSGSKANLEPENLKTFDYVICGNASSDRGLAAPYDEEETEEVVHLEQLSDLDLFDFWQQNSNSDQISERNPEARVLNRGDS